MGPAVDTNLVACRPHRSDEVRVAAAQLAHEVPAAPNTKGVQPAQDLPGQLLVAQLAGRVGPVVFKVEGEGDAADPRAW